MTKSPAKTIVKKLSTVKSKAPSKKSGGKGLKPAEQKVLDIVAGLKVKLGKDEADRKQVAASVQLGKSTFANALTTLKHELLIVTPQTLAITEAGLELANAESASIASTNEEHIKNTMEHYSKSLKKKSFELVEELKDGKVKKKKEVAESLGMTMNSTFANLLTSLKKLNILSFDRETIQLHDDMFPFGRP